MSDEDFKGGDTPLDTALVAKPKETPLGPGPGRKFGSSIELNPRQQAFVTHYLEHGNGKMAAIHIGIPEKSASSAAYHYLHVCKNTISEIEKARAAVVAKQGYTFEKAVLETYQDLKDAKEDKQHTAVAKLRENLNKMHGYMIERHEIRQDSVVINIMGIARKEDEPEEY